MISPNFGPVYYDEQFRDLLLRVNAFKAEAITINQAQWAEADTDTRFEAGDQTLWTDLYGNLPATRRKQFNFNRIRRAKNMMGGHQRRNRKSTIVTGRENSDTQTADQMTKLLMWVNQQENLDETISRAFDGALVTGMNMLQVWMDYRTDPVNGNMRIDVLNYNDFMIDPFFRKMDLSDCNGILRRSYLTKREVCSLIPSHAEEIANLPTGDYNRDGAFQYQPESYNYSLNNLLTYDEFHYRAYRNQKMLVDTETGEVLEWRNQDEDRLRIFLQAYPQIKLIEQEVPTVNVGIIVQGKGISDGPNPLGVDTYSMIPVLAYFNPQTPYYPNRIQGIVRGLRDAQYLYNRRKVIELDIMESQVSSGFIFKEDALVNPLDIYMQGQGKGIALKAEAQMTDVQQMVAPAIPPSMIELSKILAEEIQQISGVSEELLGAATDDVAGVLSMLRQGASLTTLQILFDQLDFSQKMLGKLMIDVIQANWTPGKVKRIIEEEPTQQFYNKAFGKYDAVVEEGFNTSTQKQMQFAQLLQLRSEGVNIPDDILLDAATVQNKKQLIEAVVKAQQQKQQMEQMQAQVAMQEQQAKIELAQARATADKGLGLERVSRVEENQALAVERRAEAQKDQDVGLLNLVRALKELDTVEIDQIHKLMQLSALMKPDNQPVPGETTMKLAQELTPDKGGV